MQAVTGTILNVDGGTRIGNIRVQVDTLDRLDDHMLKMVLVDVVILWGEARSRVLHDTDPMGGTLSTTFGTAGHTATVATMDTILQRYSDELDIRTGK